MGECLKMSENVRKKNELTARQMRGIEALLLHRTQAEAADAIGVKQKTLQRWLKLPVFQKAYREAQRRVVDEAIGHLQSLTSAAAETIRRNMSCDNPHAEIRAAEIILTQSLKAIELTEIIERIERLEKASKSKWRA